MRIAMNKQELFDRVWIEFYEGGRTPAFYDDTCVYNATKNGLKCAIGIQPEFQTIYNREMESSSIRTLWEDDEYQKDINKAFGIDVDDIDSGNEIPNDVIFLTSLQEAHDQWAFAVDHNNNYSKTSDEYDDCLGILEDNLRNLAYDYTLDTP
jgi:hypothetical protein